MWPLVWKRFVSFIASIAVVEGAIDCQVAVREPWPIPYVYVPRNSLSLTINCTKSASNQPSVFIWSIDLPNDGTETPYGFGTGTTDILNNNGVYELSATLGTNGMKQTLWLLINDTARNNGTEIFCSAMPSGTTLFVFDPIPFTLEVLDMDVNGTNISWRQDSNQVAVSDAIQTFSLTVSHGSSSQMISLNDSFYYFTAPEDASPCEVYNFSVAATYVGATYTGAGCSVPSPVLSMMLPSLPDIEELESSLEYGLMKSSSQTILTVTFEAAKCCEQCPMVNYVLEVNHSSLDVWNNSVSPGVENVIHNLTENTIYSFRVLVSNSVGVVSTNQRQIFTTDVQNVTATPVETIDAFVVQCDFITGSNAQGCMVVLVGELENITVNLEQNGCDVLTVSHPLSCYHEIFAFDVESDGSVGTLAVPGVLSIGKVNTSLCLTTTTDTSESGTSSLTLIISVTMSVLLLAAILSAMVVIIVYYKFGCHRKMSASNIQMTTNEVYGIAVDDKEIVMTPNEVYGVSVSTLQ